MAAPSQTSPNQASQSTDAKTSSAEMPNPAEEVTKKDPPIAAADADPAAPAEEEPNAAPAAVADSTSAPSATLPELTYAGIENSNEFLLAKRLLNDGDFDNALETIGTAMSTTMSRLPQDIEAPELHESMAPLYYLYGTTLLYSIEESDNVANMAAGGASNPAGGGEGDEEEADDSQIAWENLDVAKVILSRMLQSCSEQDVKNKLSLDLAQIHLRLGDLQRFNGRYQNAISDYTPCLEIRQPLLGVYTRKVAELHHLMGVCYTALAAEGDKQQESAAQEDDDEGAAAAPLMTPEQIEDARTKSVEHYVATAKSFAGQVAFLCGSNPEEATSDVLSSDEEGGAGSAGGGKTTGMDPKEIALYASSRTVRAIRARVGNLEVPQEHAETVHEYLEVLDELQETIDEMENAKKGIKEMASIKAQITAEAAGEEDAVNADGSTTSIGFGSAAASVASAVAAAPSGVASAGAATAAPVMMVRKKKKRDEEEQDSKMSAQDDAKRAKAE